MWLIENIEYLYHGADTRFEEISLKKAKAFKDFGRGFYLTSIPGQALEWARNRSEQHEHDRAFVYKYKVHTDRLTSDFRIDEYTNYDERWLNLIYECRMGISDPSCDIIYDKMADGNVSETLEQYGDNNLSAVWALQDLKRWKDKRDQYCFKTEKACAGQI